MTAEMARQSPGSAERRLEILLADYEACREDERVQGTVVAALMGVLVTLIGLLAAAVTQTCDFSHKSSCIKVPPYLLASSPMIPIALLAYAIYFMVAGTLRTYYMRGLENEIRKYAPDPIESLGELQPASYMSVVLVVTSLRHGRKTYRLIATLMLLVVILVFGGYTSYVALHVSVPYQVFMSAIYGGIAVLFITQVAQASIGGESLFESAARGFLSDPRRTLVEIHPRKTPSPPSSGRSLVSYLIIPRPEDWSKWLIVPGAFLAAGWSSGNLSNWPTLTELWIITEFLIYEARYQWNDVRGVGEDSLHSESRARGRLPAPTGRKQRNVLISLLIAILRLVVAIAAAFILGLPRQVLVLVVLIFSIAIFYEALRSRESPANQKRATPTVVAIWCSVGLGYGVRSGLGLVTGGLSLTMPLAWFAIFFFITFGIMFVLLTWVLEAASSYYYQNNSGIYEEFAGGIWRPKPGAVLKPHLVALLTRVPVRIEGEGANRTYSSEEDGNLCRVLDRRGRLATPWNLAMLLSTALGGGLGAGLAHAHPGFLIGAQAIGVSVAAAVLLALCSSSTSRLVVSGTAAAVLLCVIVPHAHGPVGILGAVPWLTVSLMYALFRGSNYRELKHFATDLLMSILSAPALLNIGPALLRAIIGDKAWAAAGFGKPRK